MTASDWLDIYYFVGGGALFCAIFIWPVFGFISMRRIEKIIVRSGKIRPCQWDPFWFRVYFYAWTMIMPTKNYSAPERLLLDPDDVIPNASILDQILAFIFIVSVWIFISTVFIGWIMGVE